MTGPAPRRPPRSSADLNTAKFNETRFTPRPGQARKRGRDEVLVQARIGRPIAAHQVEGEPVGAPRHEVQEGAEDAVLHGRHHDAVGVGRVAEATQGHRVAAFGLGTAPRCRVLTERAGGLAADVADAIHLRGVAGSLDPVDHLPHVAHRAALEAEVGDVDDCLVAELERGHFCFARPDVAAEFAAGQHCRYPCMSFGFDHELFDRAGPRFGIAKRITSREHHTGQHPVGDA